MAFTIRSPSHNLNAKDSGLKTEIRRRRLSVLLELSGTMTTVPNGNYATGTGKDEAELRRRNVTTQQTANGGHVYKIEAEDVKKLKKVSWCDDCLRCI